MLPHPWPLMRDQLAVEGSGDRQAESLSTFWAKPTSWAGPRWRRTARFWWPCRCPPNYSAALRDIEQSQQQYDELRKQRRRLRRTYLGYLLLLTVGVLFASTWLALYLSKMVTRPLLALAEATQEISRGRLDYRVDVQAAAKSDNW